MKYSFLLFIALFLTACSKEDVYGPLKLKNGQEVELLVDHRYAAVNNPLLILPQNEPAGLSLYGFDQREPGYTYRVKAKLNISKNPPQDGPDSWFDFSEAISKEKYEGNESFEIRLIVSYVPGGPTISLRKQDDDYYFIPEKLQLTYTNEEVRNQLEEIWQNSLEIRENWEQNKQQADPKWKSIKATVTHDPENFGKAYLVQGIQFTN